MKGFVGVGDGDGDEGLLDGWMGMCMCMVWYGMEGLGDSIV